MVVFEICVSIKKTLINIVIKNEVFSLSTKIIAQNSEIEALKLNVKNLEQQLSEIMRNCNIDVGYLYAYVVYTKTY